MQSSPKVQFTVPASAKGETPALATPTGPRTLADFCSWARANRDEIQGRLLRHGAIHFRGFDIGTAEDFEEAALALEPELGNEYLGTSPRNAQTEFVFSASELPNYYPIPQHCEMSFLAGAPRRVLFFCEIAPTSVGGETPLTDFRAVADQLSPKVRARFDKRGLRIIRNYTGPATKNRDLWQLKPWHEMFLTEDKDEVAAACVREGFDYIWRDDDRLTLISYQPAFVPHPETGDVIWFNHSQVFHTSTAEGELKRIARKRNDPRSAGLALVSRAMMKVRSRTTPSELQPMHVTYADGNELPPEDMDHVRDVIWQNTSYEPWQRGDIVLVDNRRVAHGRMPYRGPRRVLVAWA